MILAKAAVLGVATGGRSTAGLGGVAWTTDPATPGWVGRLGSPQGRALTALLGVGEAVADKLSATPSRLAPPGLVSRVAGALPAGAALGSREGGDPRLAAGAAVAGAGLGSVIGARWRTFCSTRRIPDVAAAVIEDVTVAVLVWWATRPDVPAAGRLLPPELVEPTAPGVAPEAPELG